MTNWDANPDGSIDDDDEGQLPLTCSPDRDLHVNDCDCEEGDEI
jgi:hypothetical protein